MERVTEWSSSGHAAIVNHHVNYIDRLAYYEDLEEQGRLIILPCKIGYTVYRICPWSNRSYDAHHCTVVPWKATYNRMPIIAAKLGTKIFLSREDAEKALEGVSEDA